MPILLNKESGSLLFIHIPKTAGTSIKSNIKKDVQIALDLEFKKELPCPPQHFHLELLQRLGLDSLAEKEVAIIRHPVTRFISEYAYRQKVDSKFKKISLTSFAIFATKAYEINNYLLSNHIRPQNQFISNKTKIYRLEDGLEFFLNENRDFFNSDKNTRHIKNSSNSKNITVDPRTLKRIERFYKTDMLKLGYKSIDLKLKKESTIRYLFNQLIGNLLFYLYQYTNNSYLKTLILHG